MVLTRYILPILAGAGAVFAQCDGPITIESQEDASGLSECDTIEGDVIIDSSVSGTISIEGVKEITGNLECINATGLTSLSAPSLATIGEKFDLDDLEVLSDLAFGSLTDVKTIKWVALPALSSLAFERGVTTVENVRISNTLLTSLQGLELETVGIMDINNNPYLDTVDVKNMRNITKFVDFAGNSKDLEIKLPSLEFAANMTFRNVSKVQVPALEFVNGSIGFYSNTFETISLPNLTETGQALVFQDHEQLTNISAPQLANIGAALNINDNPELETIDGFPELAVIEGALDFSGDFDEVDLPALEDVRGGVNMQTRSEDFSCSGFDELRDQDIVKGVYTCRSAEKDPGGLGTNQGSDGNGTEDAAPPIMSAAMPSYTFFGVLAFLFLL